MVILLVIQFEWTIGAQFTLNFYHNWANMAVHNVDGSGHFLQIKEGVTQGYPFVMIEYCIGILPLIHELRTAHTQITQL